MLVESRRAQHDHNCHIHIAIAAVGERQMSKLEDTLVFQLMASKLPAPEREYRFSPPRRWRFDLAWPDRLLAAEVEGGLHIFGGGRHQRASGFEADCFKYAEAALMGWMVIRVTDGMIKRGEALELICRALNIQENK